MGKIYIVTEGEYSDYHIIAATTDKDEAKRLEKRFSGHYHAPEIEVFEDCKVADLPLFEVAIYDDGHANAEERDFSDDYSFVERGEVTECSARSLGGHRYIVDVCAKDADGAIKIAAEKVAQYKAEKAGI